MGIKTLVQAYDFQTNKITRSLNIFFFFDKKYDAAIVSY